MNIIEEAKIKQEKLEELDTFIHISNEEIDKEILETFLDTHRHEGVNFGAIGGHISYNLMQTGIGFFISVKCSYCNKSENITNYDML